MSASAHELSENSPVQMAEVIAGLLSGRGVTEIAETVGIPRGRILRWYKESPRFQQMLDETTEDIIALVRAEAVREVSDQMTDLMPVAVDVLKEAMGSDNKMSERITAANSVLRFSGLGAKKSEGPVVPKIEGLLKTVADGPSTGD